MKKKPAPKINAKTLRKTAGLNQAQFWARIGVTQSGGSRYESGRHKMPKPVQTLLDIAYGAEAQASKIVAQLRGS